jgi:hypothetical protein
MTPSPEDIPFLGSLSRNGRGRGFDALILCGPLLIAALALLGRSPLTIALAAGYVSVFVLYTLVKSARYHR